MPSAGTACCQNQKITIWYTAPTAVRMMMKVGTEVIRKYDLRRLRFIASVGEPLNPEAVVWGQEAFGSPDSRQLVADRNRRHHDRQLRSRWIFVPVRWAARCPASKRVSCAAARTETVEAVTEPGVEGELALRPGWPSMFRGYLHEEERYRKCFAGGWYLTGDLAKRDADGYFWFVGRRRRRDQVVRPSDRSLRGGECADGASGGGRSRRYRQA